MNSKMFIALFLLLAVGPVETLAQSNITFRVNLADQLEDSVFVPARDQIYLIGNLYPLDNSKQVYLKDVAPTDSIYEATVKFPYRARGEKLEYTYIIETPDKKIREQMPRFIQVQSQDLELDPLYFNSFAW